MAVELASAYISLIPSARGIHNQIASELKGPLNRVASDAGDSSSRAFSTRFGAGIKNSTANIARTAAVAFGGVGIALGALGGFGLKAAGDFQQTRIAFEGILGSAEKAQSFLQKLRDFAAKTPFEFPELADAAKSLLAVGFSAEDVIPVMTRLGNVAATLGVGGEAINGVVRALGQMKGKGKASAEELNQISEQIPGFSAVKAIAESLGITTAEAFKKMESGAINADVAVDAILKGMEKFPGAAGAMGRQSKTLNGVLSTFKDTMRDALINGLEPILPALSSGLEKIAPFFGNLIGIAARGVASFIRVVQTIGPLIIIAMRVGFSGRSIAPIRGWLSIFSRVGAFLRGFIDFIKGDVVGAGLDFGRAFGLDDQSSTVTKLIKTLKVIRDAMVKVVSFVSEHWKPILAGVVIGLGLLIAPVLTVAAGLIFLYIRFKVVRDIVARLIETFRAVSKFLSKVDWEKIFKRISDTVAAFGRVFADVWRRIAPTVKQAFDTIVAVVRPVLGILVGIITLAVNVIRDLWNRFGEQLLDKIRIAFNGILTVVQGAMQFIRGLFEILEGILTLKWSKTWQGIKDVVGGAAKFVLGTVQGLVNLLSLLIGAGMAVISEVWHLAWVSIGKVVGVAVDAVVGFVTGLPGRLLGVVAAVGAAALAIGAAILHGITDGVTGAIGAVADIGKAIANAAIGFINTVIDGINDALEFKIPNPLPGSNDFHINPPNIPHIPELAKGGVFKTATVAIVGENSRTTPEIVSPVRLMAETFRQVLESTTINTSVDTSETSITADAAQATRTVRGYLIELSKMPSSVTTKVAADTRDAVRGFREFVGAVAVSADPFQQASTQIREISSETSDIQRRFRQSTDTIRKVADTTTKLTQVTQVEPVTGPDTSEATAAIRSYVAALRDIPTGVVTRLVTDTQDAAIAVSGFVTAVSVSPVPFEQASVHIRNISREISTVDEQMKRSTRTIRDVADTSGAIAGLEPALSLPAGLTIFTPSVDLTNFNQAIQRSGETISEWHRRLVELFGQRSGETISEWHRRIAEGFRKAVAAMGDDAERLRRWLLALSGVKVAPTVDVTKFDQTVKQSIGTASQRFTEWMKRLNELVPQRSGETLNEWSRRIQDFFAQRAGETLSEWHRRLSGIVAGTDKSGTTTAAVTKQVTTNIQKASTSFAHSLQEFPKTVLKTQQFTPSKQSVSGKFDLTVKPTAPIVTPAAQLAPTFQTDLKTSEPKSFVGVAKQEIHVDRQSVVEEIGVLNKRLGMRVAIAGRR